ncbi:MAG: transglutaminase domain-containing protein [bacterium]|nr:transglutaminase domain-containing protein [bacterium]
MIFYVTAISLFFFLSATFFPQDADFSISKSIEIDIDDIEDGKYKFTYLEKNILTRLTETDTDSKDFIIYENYFNETNSIEVRSRSVMFYKRNIPYVIPEDEDIFISGGKLYYFSVPEGIKKGESWRYEFEQDYIDVTYLPLVWLNNNYEYESVKLIFSHPDDIKPIFNVQGIFQEYPFDVKYVDTDETIFEIANIKPSNKLNYFPFNDYLLFIFIDLQKQGTSINNVTPDEFVDWYSSLTSINPELEQKDKQILSKEISACSTQTEKIKTIYNFVRENFRYIAEEQGKNSIVPRMPSVVLARGYADCKERASLMSAIAREHGIDINMTLVTKETAVGNKYIYIDKFDHVICSSTINNETIFFDPTAKYCEFGNLPDYNIGRDAFILDSDNPTLQKIKAPVQEPSFVINIYASSDSLGTAKAIITLHNDYFSYAKHAINDLSGAKLENFLSAIVLKNLYKISLDYFTEQFETENSLTFSTDADLSEFVISSASKKYIPKVPFLFLDRDVLERAKDSLSFYLPERISMELNIILDNQNYSFEPDSLYLSDKEELTLFKSRIREFDNNKLLISYSLAIEEKKLNNQQKKEFINFYDSYLINKPNMFILKAK